MKILKNSIYPAAKSVSGVFLILFAACIFNQNIYAQPSAGGAIVAIDEVQAGAGGGVTQPVAKLRTKPAVSQNTKSTTKISRNTASNTVKKSNNRAKISQTKNSRTYDGFVIGDKYTFLNFEIARGVKPVHTIAAKNAGASGLVQVEVLIDTDGTVLTAKARTGNRLLHPEAERAALGTVFNKPTVYGKPARAAGFLVYRFGNSED